MARKRLRGGPRRRPPWWFMPAVMTGLGIAALALSAVMLTILY